MKMIPFHLRADGGAVQAEMATEKETTITFVLISTTSYNISIDTPWRLIPYSTELRRVSEFNIILSSSATEWLPRSVVL